MFDSGDDKAAAGETAPQAGPPPPQDVPCAPRGKEIRSEPWRRLSHELGTPLHAILGHAELLLDGSFGPLGTNVRSCVAEIQGAGRQLALEFRRLLLIVEAAGAPFRLEELVDLKSTFRHAFAKRPGGDNLVWQGDPLVIGGERFWLRAMAEALADVMLSDRAEVSPTVRSERSPRDIALEIHVPGLQEREADPVALALIQVIAARQGADARWLPGGGLRLAGLRTCELSPRPDRIQRLQTA